MNEQNYVVQHYAIPELLQKFETRLKKMGKSLDNLSLDDLSGADELHSRGIEATYELIEVLDINSGMHILDIGAGIGGPARRLAQLTGGHVTCLDLTADFCSTGAALTKYCGLQHQVKHIQGDATNMHQLEDNSFDAAWTIHAGMNISDKKNYYSEIYRVLKPNAKFVIYDIFTKYNSPNIKYPVPWSQTENTSFLITLKQLEHYLENSQFNIINTFDKTKKATNAFQNAFDNLNNAETLPPLGPQLIMGKTALIKIGNLLNNFKQGQLAVHGIVCTKATK